MKIILAILVANLKIVLIALLKLFEKLHKKIRMGKLFNLK